jgi:hypothetical protein
MWSVSFRIIIVLVVSLDGVLQWVSWVLYAAGGKAAYCSENIDLISSRYASEIIKKYSRIKKNQIEQYNSTDKDST